MSFVPIRCPNVAYVAKRLGVPPRVVRNLIRRGDIAATKVGKRYCVENAEWFGSVDRNRKL
jgi:excisionase family DNA binding protein